MKTTKIIQIGKQFAVFGLGGVTNYLLNIGLTYALTEWLGWYYLLSFTVVQMIIIVYNFLYHNWLTFRGARMSGWTFIKYLLWLGVFALINIGLVKLTTDYLQWHYMISIFAVTAVTMVVKFLIYRKYVFID